MNMSKYTHIYTCIIQLHNISPQCDVLKLSKYKDCCFILNNDNALLMVLQKEMHIYNIL